MVGELGANLDLVADFMKVQVDHRGNELLLTGKNAPDVEVTAEALRKLDDICDGFSTAMNQEIKS